MISVTGRRSAIIRELLDLTGCVAEPLGANCPLPVASRFVMAAGLLRCKRKSDQTTSEIAESRRVNLDQHIDLCEAILERDETARICIIGSASAWQGSFDGVYAENKAALHRYVEQRAVGARQQLVAVAPHIIADAGMTLRRPDYSQTMALAKGAPRGRWIRAREVAAVIRWLLWSDEGAWVNNTVVRLSGGVRSGASAIAASGRG